MMFCPACGKPMHESAAACPSCGRPNSVLVQGGDVENSSWLGFRGRVSRSEYWLHYALPLVAVTIAAAVLDSVAEADGVLAGIVSLLLIVPSLAGYVKRAHDRDRSGWFLFVGLIPLIGTIWLFVELGCLRGTAGANRFGRDPLRQAAPLGGAGPAFS